MSLISQLQKSRSSLEAQISRETNPQRLAVLNQQLSVVKQSLQSEVEKQRDSLRKPKPSNNSDDKRRVATATYDLHTGTSTSSVVAKQGDAFRNTRTGEVTIAEEGEVIPLKVTRRTSTPAIPNRKVTYEDE